MNPGKPFSWPGDRLLFPDEPAQSDVPLNCFHIDRVTLQPDDGTVLLSLDSHFGHFDEHGCLVLIRGGQVERFGTWDEVLADDEDWEEE